MRLPLFDDLPDGAVARLSAAGLGRGLLTPSLRARLRKAGFADMGMLALATPIDLTAVRKIGPVRLGAIRAHVLDELARLYSGARQDHSEHATATRRVGRLGAMPVKRLLLDTRTIERFGCTDRSCADFVVRLRAEGIPTSEQTADCDEIVAALVRLLLLDQPYAKPTAVTREDDAAQEAEALRERDREWDEAAPAR